MPHALAAAAVAEWMGVAFDEVAAALEAGSRVEHRMAVTVSASGATLIDDTYNASPISWRPRSGSWPRPRSRPAGAGYAVLGDMLELGPDEERLHREIGNLPASTVDELVAVGARGAWIAEAARAAGLARIHRADDAESAASNLDRQLAPGVGDLVLVKGSRGVALDRTVERCRGDAA